MALTSSTSRAKLPFLIAATLAPCAGHAQQVGIYAGKEANGAAISISVVEDAYLHKLAIAGLTSFVSARCRDNVDYNATTTVAPGLVPITGNTVLYRWDFGTYYVSAKMTFDDANNAVSGDIVSYNVIFGAQRNGVPIGATFCTDPGTHFSAVLTPGSSINPKADVVLTKGWQPQ